jgi:protein gp37
MAQSSIEWTEMTWNPTTGCSKISAGCKYCYAEVMSRRLQAMGIEKYKDNFEVRTHPDALAIPYTWRKPKVVFVNSMSDLFHEEIPLSFIQEVFKVMNDNPIHIFQVLTKRAERLEELHQFLEWSPNIWMGVSVESKKFKTRIDSLRNTAAQVKFLSLEPLLAHLGPLNLTGIDWVIVGGESGAKARPMKQEWVENIQLQCSEQKAPFFFKQWGGRNKKAAGRTLNGQTYDEMPSKLEKKLYQSEIELLQVAEPLVYT